MLDQVSMVLKIYCPRPLMYTKDPEDLKELREYLIEFDKRQREKEKQYRLTIFPIRLVRRVLYGLEFLESVLSPI